MLLELLDKRCGLLWRRRLAVSISLPDAAHLLLTAEPLGVGRLVEAFRGLRRPGMLAEANQVADSPRFSMGSSVDAQGASVDGLPVLWVLHAFVLWVKRNISRTEPHEQECPRSAGMVSSVLVGVIVLVVASWCWPWVRRRS